MIFEGFDFDGMSLSFEASRLSLHLAEFSRYLNGGSRCFISRSSIVGLHASRRYCRHYHQEPPAPGLNFGQVLSTSKARRHFSFELSHCRKPLAVSTMHLPSTHAKLRYFGHDIISNSLSDMDTFHASAIHSGVIGNLFTDDSYLKMLELSLTNTAMSILSSLWMSWFTAEQDRAFDWKYTWYMLLQHALLRFGRITDVSGFDFPHVSQKVLRRYAFHGCRNAKPILSPSRPTICRDSLTGVIWKSACFSHSITWE